MKQTMRFSKVQAPVEAVQWTGRNQTEVARFILNVAPDTELHYRPLVGELVITDAHGTCAPAAGYWIVFDHGQPPKVQTVSDEEFRLTYRPCDIIKFDMEMMRNDLVAAVKNAEDQRVVHSDRDATPEEELGFYRRLIAKQEAERAAKVDDNQDLHRLPTHAEYEAALKTLQDVGKIGK